MYPSCGEDEESVVMFEERVRSYKLGLMGWGWYNHTLSLSIERKYSPVKRGFLLVQHYDHDLDVLRYHDRPDSGWKGSTKWASLM